MLMAIIMQFNWVDITIITFLIVISGISVKRGFSIELFKLAGTTCAIYLGMHYFTLASDTTAARLSFSKENMPLEFLDFVCFLGLVLLGHTLMILLRKVFCRFIKFEAVPVLNKLGGFLLGATRGILFSGLIVFMLTISSIDYLKDSAYASYSGGWFSTSAVNIYTGIWEKITSKFMSTEKFNKTVTEVQDGYKNK